MNGLASAWIVDACRSPIGKHRGALAPVRSDDLAAAMIRAIAARTPSAAEHIEHVVFGSTNQAGEDNRNVARMASLLAGLPYEVPAVTVNRLCGSGLEAVCDAVRRVWTGDAECVIAGGVESMTRAPYVLQKPDEAFSRSVPKMFDTSLGWRFENPKLAERFPLQSMGETAENVAEKWKISREDQDAFAVQSHQRAHRAQEAGAFDREIVPIEIPQRKGEPEVVKRDESIRPDANVASMGKLAPVFRKGGSVTAGNSSPLNDGASAVLVVSERFAKARGLEPLARVVAFATAGVEPNFMGEGPIPATKRALERAAWKASELDRVELNEAFAAQAIACMRGLDLDAERVNVCGGGIALGHPIGSSGSRVLGTLLWEMKRSEKKRGLAALCIGVGQGIAMLVER